MNNNAASEQMFPNIALKSFFMVIFALMYAHIVCACVRAEFVAGLSFNRLQ